MRRDVRCFSVICSYRSTLEYRNDSIVKCTAANGGRRIPRQTGNRYSSSVRTERGMGTLHRRLPTSTGQLFVFQARYGVKGQSQREPSMFIHHIFQLLPFTVQFNSCTFSFKRYIHFLMFRINKFRIRKKNILLYVSFIKYILRNSPIIQTNEALHKMSLPVKVRQRQLHMRMNVFILTGMFILIFMCPIMTVMASYTFMCHLKAPLSAIRAL